MNFAALTPAMMPSAEELVGIVARVRKLAAEKRHVGIVDDHLGKALASSPVGADGAWPHESVRDVLERYNSKALADGFVVGKCNLRGVTSRSLGDGGEQEQPDDSQQRVVEVQTCSQFFQRLAQQPCFFRDDLVITG